MTGASCAVLALTLTGALTCLLLTRQAETVVLEAALISLIALVLLRWATSGLGLWDPIVLAALIYAGTGILGLLLYSRLAKYVPLSHVVPLTAPARTATVFLLFGAALLAGALTTGRATAERVRRGADLEQTVAAAVGRHAEAAGLFAIVLGAVTAVVLLTGAGAGALWSRDSYQGFGRHPTLLSLGELLLIPALLSLFMAYWRAGAGRRIVLVALAALVFFYAFATSGRAMALAPGLLLLSRVLALGVRLSWRSSALCGSSTFLLLCVALTLRGAQYHGAAPYLAFLASHLGQVFSVGAGRVSQNLLQSFAFTDYLAFGHTPLDRHYTVVSLNPLPGSMAGWGAVAPQLRLNAVVPYNTLGHLANASRVMLTAYGLLAGCMMGAGVRQMERLPGSLARAMAFGGTMYFVLISLQYPLRSSTRMLYYGLVILTLCGLYRRITRKQPSSSPSAVR